MDITIKPPMNPMIGDATIGTITFQKMPSYFHHGAFATGRAQMSADHCPPAEASVAPHRPPISACDELDGRPNHHVIRFQTIAPSNAAMIVSDVTNFVSTNPPEIVFATAV